MREAGRALIARWRELKTRELELLRELADLNVDPGARREYLIARENEAHRLQGRAARATLDAEKRRIAETPVATGDALLANTRAIGHVTVESRESYIRRKMAENGWDRQTAIAQATHLYPEDMADLRAPWANSQLYTGKGGHSPDTAAQALHDEGRLADPTVDAFWDAVRGDIETIGKAKRRELDAAEAEAAAALAWGKQRHEQTLAAIELQDDAVGLGLGKARSSISGRRSTANVGNDVLTTLEDLDVGKDVFFDLKGRGRLRVTLGQDGPGGFGIMHIVEGRMLKDGQDLDGAIRTVLRVVEAATHGKFLRHKQGRDNYGKDGAIAVIAYEKAKADGTPSKGDFVLTGYEEFTSDAERKRADARAAALRRAGRYALPPHARSEEVVAALHRIIANIQNARKSDSARSSIGGLYSGGPSAYNRPSLRAIGTNDAGRAYGWGLYATTERDMAEGYAGATWRELANAFRFGGKTYAELTQDDPEAARLIEGYTATAIAEKRARGYDPEALKRDLQRDRAWLADYLADPENAPENMDAYPQSKQDRLRRFQTRLQNVERLLQADIAMTERGIPAVHEQLWWTNRPDGDESHLLTWDARISEENRKRVIEAVRSLGLTDAQLAEHFGAKWDSTPMTGEQAYGFVTEAIRDLAKLDGDAEALASQLLARHDVDGTVRHFPAGGSIYVAFSDEHLQVVNRWIWDEETQAFVKDESFDRNAPEARSSIGGIFTGARMPYDRADSRFIGSGTGGQNEGFGHYGSGVRGVAQGKYASAYIPKKPKTWAQLPVNGDKRFPTLGKLGRICKTWTRVMPAEEENAWMFFAALANDAVSGKLPKGNVKAALKQAIRDELERERQAAEAYHAWRDATIPALLRGEQAERKTRRQEAAESRAASAYETYIKLGFDKDEVLDERLDELLDVPVNIPAVMEQVWFTNRPEGDLSHLLNWLEPVPEEQKQWIRRAFERRHGDAETRSIVDDALAEEKITGRDLYEALRQFYWGTLRDTGMVTTEDLIQSEVAQFLLSADIDGTPCRRTSTAPATPWTTAKA